MKDRMRIRGLVVYRLAGLVKWAAFKFLAITTALFIWASFHSYFVTKYGDFWAAVLGSVAVVIMFALIDKGLDALIEFLADEKMNPSTGDDTDPAHLKARKIFLRTVIVLAVFRLLATGTTSIWGSFEIAAFVTEKKDDTHLIEQINDENRSLETGRNSLRLELETARKTEGTRVKQARKQGAELVTSALSRHAKDDVREGVRKAVHTGTGWYAKTPNLEKYREGVAAAVADSARIVQAEVEKVRTIEADLMDLEKSGRKSAEGIKAQLAAVAASNAQEYTEIKARRTNFLIIADIIAVLFGILGVWLRATYRAAVGRESELEERTLEGIAAAAVKKWTNGALEWLENLLGVDLDGNGAVGSVGSGAVSSQGNTGTSTGNSLPGNSLPPNLRPVSNSGGAVVAQGSSLILLDVSLLKKATRKQWERAYTSKDASAKEDNRKKAMQGVKELEKLGYNITRWVEDIPGGGKIGRMKIEIESGGEVN